MDSPKPQQHWLRYSLRSMFVVVTLLCVIGGWTTVQLKRIHDRGEVRMWLHDTRARQLAADKRKTIPQRRGSYISSRNPPASWDLKIFGESGVEQMDVYEDSFKESNYNLDYLKSLFPEAEVSVVARPGRIVRGERRIDYPANPRTGVPKPLPN